MRAGEVHALLGENGAGKTTLVSIAAGLLPADTGRIHRAGREARFADPRAARAAGISLVPQHDLLVPALSVADNLALLDPGARFFASPRARRERVRDAEAASGLALGDPDARAGELGVAARQRVGIAGALLGHPEVLVLDEPTAVLAPREVDALFATLRALATRGRAVVLITHRLREVFAVADRLTLLSRGRTLLESHVREVSPERVAALLFGGAEEIPATSATPAAPAGGAPTREPEGAALGVSRLVPAGSHAAPLSLTVAPGEGLTLLAVGGNGAEEIAEAIAGMRARSGKVTVGTRAVAARDVGAFRAAGGGFVPGDRLAEGLVPEMDLAENLALTARGRGLLLDRAALDRRASEAIARFGIRAFGPRAPAGTLSGGNQQKLVLARELLGDPRLLVALHPTRGLDVAATAEVHRRLAEAREGGTALLVVTADPEEARVLNAPIRVVYRGALSPELDAATPPAELARWLSGLAA